MPSNPVYATVEAKMRVASNYAHATARTGKAVRSAASAGTIVREGKVYDGEYVAIPKDHEQTFATKDAIMREDFTVREIMLHDAPNQYGTTITIGD